MVHGRTALGLISLVGVAHAQIPDVRIKVDLGLTTRIIERGRTTFRFYDPLGRPSIVGLSLYLEPGFRVYAGQRIQIVPGGPKDPVDELYIEDEGNWRAGRQYIPFGNGRLIGENANGLRADTSLIFEGLPVSFVVFDNGSGYAQGYSARLGSSNLGLSAAVGNRIGASGTSLGVVRYPGDAPGPGRGWGLALGGHFFRRLGRFDISAETVLLRRGETAFDDDLSVLDFTFGYRPFQRYSVALGYSRAFERREDFYRLSSSLPVEDRLSLEPLVRFRGGSFLDLGLTLRVRF